MTTGEKIRRLRKEKGLTQEELGNEVGLQKAAINKYETGIVVNIKRARLDRIAKALGVNPVWLMDDNSGWPPVESVQAIIRKGLDSLEGDSGKMLRDHMEAKEISELYMSLSPANRAAARKYMAFLKDQEIGDD